MTLKNRRGAVLIVVLIFVAAAVTAALFLHERSVTTYASVSELQNEYQSAIHAQTALAVAISLLEDDDDDSDSKDDDWADLPPFPFENGFIVVTVKPLNGRIDLGALKKEEKQERVRKAMETLFQEGGIPVSYALITDWIDNNTEAVNGSEDTATYTRYGKTYHGRNLPLATIQELALIPQLEPYMDNITAWFSTGEGTGVMNLNFADNATIAAYLPEIASYASRIVEKRDEAAFTSPTNVLDAGVPQGTYLAIKDLISTKSSYFAVKIEVSLKETTRFYHALLKRDRKKVTVLTYTEGAYEDRF